MAPLLLNALRPPGLCSHMVSSHVRERPRTFQAPHCPAACPASQPAALTALSSPQTLAIQFAAFCAFPTTGSATLITAPPSAAPPSPQALQIFALTALPIVAPTEAPQKVQFPPNFIALLPAKFQVFAEAVEILDEAGIMEDFLASLEGQGDEDKAGPLLQDPHSKSLAPAPLLATQACAQQALSPLPDDDETSIITDFLASLEGQGNEDKESPLLKDLGSLAPALLVATHAHDDTMETQQSPRLQGSKEWITLEPLPPTQSSEASTKVSPNFNMHKFLQLHNLYSHCNAYMLNLILFMNCIDQYAHKLLPIYSSIDMMHALQLLCIDLILINNHTSHALHVTTSIDNIMCFFMHAHSKHLSIMHNLLHLVPNLHAFCQAFSILILKHAKNSLALAYMHASSTCTSCYQAYLLNAHHVVPHALNAPYHNPEPNMTNDGVLTKNLYYDNSLCIYNHIIMTQASISPQGGKQYEAQAIFKRHVAYNTDIGLKDGVNTALSKVKMKTKLWLIILFGINSPFDPG